MARKPRKTMREKGREIVKEQTVGAGEPKMVGGQIDKMWLIKAYNWYGANVEPKMAVAWLNKHLGGETFPPTSNHPKIIHLGYIARMMDRKINLPDTTLAFFSRTLKEVLTPVAVEKPTARIVPAAAKSIQEKLRDRVESLIAHLEVEVDKFATTFKDPISVKKFLQEHDPKGTAVKAIITRFEPVMKEVAGAALKSDEVLVEAYRGYTEVELKKFARFLAMMISEAKAFKVEDAPEPVKKTRKPRAINVAKNFAKLKFQKEDPENKLVSEDPLLIHGAKALWVFNTKYNKLGIFIAEADKKLSVMGTSIINFDEEKSVQRTIRKPELIAATIDSRDTVGKNLMLFYKAQKTTIAKQRSRIGEDTILLKVLR